MHQAAIALSQVHAPIGFVSGRARPVLTTPTV